MTHTKFIVCAALIVVFAAACAKSAETGTPGASGFSGGAGTPGAAGTGATTGPVQLVSAPGCGSMSLVVIGGVIYWTEKGNGTVNSIPTAGGATAAVASSQKMPGPIAADTTAIFWGNDGDMSLMKKPLPTGALAPFGAASTDVVHALLIANGTLYIGRGISTYKVPTAGGTAVHLSQSPPDDRGVPGAFAVSATHLYQTELEHLAVSRESLDGMQNGLLQDGVTRLALAPDRIAVPIGGLVSDAIALAGGQVLWANGSGIETHDANTGEAVPPLRIAASAGHNSITGFVVSGNTIYLGESSDNTVEKVALNDAPDGGAPREANVIATDQMTPSQFAADTRNIYWRTEDCKIMKLAK